MSSNVVSFSLSVAQRVFLQPWAWFSHLLSSSGMTGIFLSALAMYLAFKFLVLPIIGGSSGSSDTAKKNKKGGG